MTAQAIIDQTADEAFRALQAKARAEDGQRVDTDAVQAAFDQLLSTRSHSTDFGSIVDGLLAGGDSDGSGSDWQVVDRLFAEWPRRNDPLSIEPDLTG